MASQDEVWWRRRGYCDLPSHRVIRMKEDICEAASGPDDGVKNILLELTNGCEPICEWNTPKEHPRAFGNVTSLYNRDPITNCIWGDPVADVYAVIARENSCILALADGANWGEKPRLAARCAVAGCLQHLNRHLFTANTTLDIMSILFNAFENAHKCIIKKDALMTTLCVAVVCQLKDTDRWGLCVVNVGDSLAFTYRNSKGVQEVTIGSHCDNEERNMRCPGGSLGPVEGYNPDLRNLTFSFTILDAGDIVFLTSDGVSDNFDPVISQCNLDSEIPTLTHTKSLDSMVDESSKSERTKEVSMDGRSKSDHDLPQAQLYDLPIVRHRKMLDDMTKVIQKEGLIDISAKVVCAKLLLHVLASTDKKRKYWEQIDRDNHNPNMGEENIHEARERDISRRTCELPGKLDHAAVVAFEVGHFCKGGGKRRGSIYDFFAGLKKNGTRRASIW